MVELVRCSPPLRISASLISSVIKSVKLLRPRLVSKVPIWIDIAPLNHLMTVVGVPLVPMGLRLSQFLRIHGVQLEALLLCNQRCLLLLSFKNLFGSLSNNFLSHLLFFLYSFLRLLHLFLTLFLQCFDLLIMLFPDLFLFIMVCVGYSLHSFLLSLLQFCLLLLLHLEGLLL